MLFKNQTKVSNMVSKQNDRIASRCAKLSQLSHEELLNARREKITLRDLKKQHFYVRCYIKKHLRQKIADLKVRINLHRQTSATLLSEITKLEKTCITF